MSSNKRIQFGFQVTSQHGDLIRDAAELRRESVAGYMRRVILEWSAAELGRNAPDLSEYAGDIIANAARQMGLSVTDFTAQAAREAAARMLGQEDSALSVFKAREAERTTATATRDRAGAIEIRESERPPASHQSGEHKVAAGVGRRGR